jgi:hypothetical protein
VYNCGVAERYLENRPQEFENEYCKFKPFDWEEIDGVLRPILFKVVTSDLKSLGLRRNPNIMQFPLGEWVKLSDDKIVPDKKGWGGIWGKLTLSDAKGLAKYMLRAHETPTRIFLTGVDNSVYANRYSIKSQGVILLRELDFSLSQ